MTVERKRFRFNTDVEGTPALCIRPKEFGWWSCFFHSKLKSPDDHRGCDNSLSRIWWDWDESQACDGIRMILQIEVRPR